MRSWSLLVAMALAACDGPASDPNPSETDDTDPGGEDVGYPSTFATGKFRMTAFVLEPLDQGADLDGDGTADNNLPKLLDFADQAVGGEMSRDEINTAIADSLASGELNILLDASHVEGRLAIAILGATVDEAGVLTIDPRSLDASGEPTSVLDGTFSTETAFSTSADRIDVPATFVEGEQPLLVPIALAQLSGDLSVDAATGLLVGVAPSQAVLDQIIDPLVPEEGYDNDGDGDIDMTKEQVMSSAEALVNNENMADWVFEDGTRGITLAFAFEAAPFDW